jgi:AcrR family transcriptional regulator
VSDAPPDPAEEPLAAPAQDPPADPAPDAPLDRDRIVQAALALVDAGGIDRLSMRRLARALGTAPMSLYRHVGDKEELLRLVVEAVADRLSLPASSVSWDETVLEVMTSIRALLRDHPGVATLASNHTLMLTPAVLRAMDVVLAALLEAGLDARDAARTFGGLWAATLGGLVMQHSMATASPASELAEAERRRLAEHLVELAGDSCPAVAAAAPHWATLDDEAAFRFTISLALEGVRARVAGRAA